MHNMFLARFLIRFLSRVLTKVLGKLINTVYSTTRPKGKTLNTIPKHLRPFFLRANCNNRAGLLTGGPVLYGKQIQIFDQLFGIRIFWGRFLLDCFFILGPFLEDLWGRFRLFLIQFLFFLKSFLKTVFEGFFGISFKGSFLWVVFWGGYFGGVRDHWECFGEKFIGKLGSDPGRKPLRSSQRDYLTYL